MTKNIQTPATTVNTVSYEYQPNEELVRYEAIHAKELEEYRRLIGK